MSALHALLDVRDLRVAHGQVQAVRGVSFTVAEGRVTTLVGANGAGKTTTLRCLSGLHRPGGGEVWLDGARVDGMPAHRLVRRGVAHVPEGRRVFPLLSVRQNLELGAFARPRRDPARARDLRAVLDRFPVLAARAGQPAGTLSGGEQQMLALGRALMSRPRLLMLDEPAMGLAPALVADLFATIRELAGQGVGILLVEQNAAAALEIADTACVLESGRITLTGSGQSLLGNPAVRQAYLGEQPGTDDRPVIT